MKKIFVLAFECLSESKIVFVCVRVCGCSCACVCVCLIVGVYACVRVCAFVNKKKHYNENQRGICA